MPTGILHTVDRATYLAQVGERCEALVNQQNDLPCKFVIAGGWSVISDVPVILHLEAEGPFGGVFEGGAIFDRIQRQLNEEFRANPWFFGIKIGVPHCFLGRIHMLEILQQEADNQRYRRVKKTDAIDHAIHPT